MKNLIKKYEELLSAPITPENILELKRVRDGLNKNPEVRLQKIENERLDYLDGRKSWTDIQKPAQMSGVTVNLIILDKETIPELRGFRKYALGYALDTKKKFEGDNIINGIEAIIPETNYAVGTVLAVKVKGAEPSQRDTHYGVLLDAPFAFIPSTERVNSSKEILRKIHAAGMLRMEKVVALDLVKTGILQFDIDKHFGIGVDKETKIVKAKGFMENGVVYGIVYPVNEVDADGDYATPDEVQKACWRFMEDFQKFNFMHDTDLSARDVALVECACALADVPELGFKKGDWYAAIKVHNKDLREKIEKGEITGFSMEGSAQPGVPIEGMVRR